MRTRLSWPLAAASLLLALAGSGCRPQAPAAADAAAASPPELAVAGAVLLDGLGDYRFPVTSSHPEVQRWFDQGLALTWGFNHDAAERSFLKAAELDPGCAMCWWGASLVLGPHVNATMDPADHADAWNRLQRARELAPNASAREQAFIEALAARYAEQPPEDRRALDQAYAEATRRLVRLRPDDLDAAVLHAEALMDLQPWAYYDEQLRPQGHTAEIVSTLESVMARNPDHAGALHLYVHAVEASADPQRGVEAADRLRELVPGSGHLVHMPAHTYIRVGRYHDATLTNFAATTADQAFLSVCRGSNGVYPLGYVPHNWHFAMMTAGLTGSSALAMQAAAQTAQRADRALMAAAAEDKLNYNEPSDWPLPTRPYLGAALLEADDAKGAADVYRQDLQTYPDNGWSLFGLAQAQRTLGDAAGAADSERRYRAAWQWADAPLTASRY